MTQFLKLPVEFISAGEEQEEEYYKNLGIEYNQDAKPNVGYMWLNISSIDGFYPYDKDEKATTVIWNGSPIYVEMNFNNFMGLMRFCECNIMENDKGRKKGKKEGTTP